MNKIGLATWIVTAMTMAAAPVISHTQSAKLSFEVVSIKRMGPNAGPLVGPGSNKYYTRATLRSLLRLAYAQNTPGAPMDNLKVKADQLEISGAPKWIDSDVWDVEALMDCSTGPYSFEQLQQMIQSMLEDRFQLKTHTETRDVPMYNLVVGKDGPKIKPSADQTPTRQSRLSSSPQYCRSGPAEPALLPGPPPGQRATLTLSDPDFIGSLSSYIINPITQKGG